MTASDIQQELFLTLKDYKPDFQQNPSCRLINPEKNKLGKVSKLILEKIHKKSEKEINRKLLYVTMDSFEGNEICEPVGLYIQSNLENILPKTNFGLYRDNGLILLRNLNGQQMDKKRTTFIKIFKDIGFSIDI